MTNKEIFFKNVARSLLFNGMSIMVEAVAVTLGPKGRNVVLDKKYGSPQIINDGVSIAREIELLDNVQNTGVALIRQAASKTNDVAGDGTTTATILAHAIVKEGMKNIIAGSNAISLKIGLEKALKFLIWQIDEYSKPVKSLNAIFQVATISAGNDPEIGYIISKAINQVGKDGVISLEESNSIRTEVEISEGMKFEKGFLSAYFITDFDRMEAILENPYILITDKKITLVKQDLIPILEQIVKTKRPLLIIASDIEREALTTLIFNKLRNIVSVVGVRAPGFGQKKKDFLEDIAILTQGQVISDETGLMLDTITINQLGQARRIIVTKETTTIISNEGNNQIVGKHCENLRKQIKLVDDIYEKEKLTNRIAKLSGGVAIIKIGAITETEMKDKKLRLEDSINATKAAIEEGIVPGGGAMFTHLAESLKIWSKMNLREDELIGGLILAKAILTPLSRIAENAGKNSSLIIEKISLSKFNIGYDAGNDKFGDMFQLGIIDPAKVSRSAIQNATSIASMILTTECVIAEI